jgi:tetratricopeptide (TPR) repeat protein
MPRNRINPAASSFHGRLVFSVLIACLTAHHSAAAQDSRAGVDPTEAEVAQLVDRLRSPSGDDELSERAIAVGKLLLRKGRYREAAQLFGVLAEKQPDNAIVSYSFALATFNSGKPTEAEPLAQRAFSLANGITGPERPQRAADALVLLAVIHAVRNDDAAALKALQQAVALAPNHFDAQLALGRLLFGMGDDTGAIKAFRAATSLQPANPQAQFFLATGLERSGDIENAVATYRKLIANNPEMFEGHLGLGALLLKRGGPGSEEGLKELTRALEINPNLYEARVTLGRALIANGRPLEAIEHLERAAQLAPDNPEPHYQLSLAYRRLGRKAEAAAQAIIVKRIHESRRSPKVATQSRLG